MQKEPVVLPIEGVGFTERELKLIAHVKNYDALGQFGIPDHLWYEVVSKLVELVENKGKFQLKSDFWSSVD